MIHSQDCESATKAKIAELDPQIQYVCNQFVSIKKLIAEGHDEHELTAVKLANQIMALECLKEQFLSHLLEHKVDSLDARVLELEMNMQELVKQAVKNYFDPRLDSEES